MWDLLNKLSHGNRPMRHIFLLVTAVTMAWFATFSPLFTSQVSADEVATRTNEVISYAGKTYSHTDSNDDNKLDTLPSGLPSGTDGFVSLDETNKKAYFILVTTDYKTATTGQYVEYNYSPPSTFSSPKNSKTITIKGSAEDNTTTLGNGSTTSCDSGVTGSVGWMVCPVMNFLAGMMDKIYGILTDFLEVQTISSNQQSSIYKLWSMVRDVANVCFVIAILVIIFSQISNLGISNYGIKKLLPRIIIGAVLVNISYWVSALAVDLSNLLGYSIHATFMDVVNKINVTANYNTQAPNWESVTAVVLSGGAGAAAIGLTALDLGATGAAVSVLVPVLVGVILAAVIAFLIMAARQALILCFVMISPLAFVAYLLPNTEKYFEKWLKAFTTLLVLFPLFSIIFSGAQIAGIAIVQNAGNNLINVILGMAVQVAPIVITPMLIKFSGGIIGKFAGIVNNPKKGLIDRSRNWSQGIGQDLKNRSLHGKPIKDHQGKIVGFKKRRFHAPQRAYDTHKRKVENRRKAYEQIGTNRFNQTRQGRNIGHLERYGSTQGSVISKRMDNRFLASKPGQDMEIASRNLGADNSEIMNRISASQGGQAAEVRTRNAATRKKEIDTHFNRTHHDVIRREQMASVDSSAAENEFNDSAMGQQVDHARRMVETTKKRIENDHEVHWNNAIQHDSAVKALNLELKSSEIGAEEAKKRVEKMYAEVVAKGDTSEHVINLRGATAQTQEHVLQLARDIKSNTITTSLTDMATSQAKRQIDDEITEAVKNNTVRVDGKTAREYAAGVGNESAVFAAAIAKSRKTQGDEVSEFIELAHHFKLNPAQIERLAMRDGTVEAEDDNGNKYTFDGADEYTQEMAVEEIFKTGAFKQKQRVINSVGKVVYDEDGNQVFFNGQPEGVNYRTRRTVMQAMISNNFKAAAPAMDDKVLSAVNDGLYNGVTDEQYHSFRDIYEGRLNSSKLSTANAAALKRFFVDIDSNPMARAQYNRLMEDKANDIQNDNPGMDHATALTEAKDIFARRHTAVHKRVHTLLKTPTIEQNAVEEALTELQKFDEGYSEPRATRA